MPMNDLLQTRIFGLLNETSQEITNEEMQMLMANLSTKLELWVMKMITQLFTGFL